MRIQKESKEEDGIKPSINGSEVDKVEVAFTTKKGKTVKFCRPKIKGDPAKPTGESLNCPICHEVHPVLSFKGVGALMLRTWDCPKIGCKTIMRGKKAQKIIEDEWLVEGTKKPLKLSPKKEPAVSSVSHVRETTPNAPVKTLEKTKDEKWEIDDDLLRKLGLEES